MPAYRHYAIVANPGACDYQLLDLLVMLVRAKNCGEDTPSGIAGWVKHRGEQIRAWLKLERKNRPRHSTYRLSMDEKVLRGRLDVEQKGTYLLAADLPAEGLVLMEVAIAGNGSEIPVAPQLLMKCDLRDMVVMGMPSIPREKRRFRSSRVVPSTSGL